MGHRAGLYCADSPDTAWSGQSLARETGQELEGVDGESTGMETT